MRNLWTAFYVAVLLFAVALVVGGQVAMGNPDCFTCGSRVALTLWIMGICAHQPVLWVNELSRARRVVIWCTAVAIGSMSYIGVEILAATLMSAGSVSAGLRLGIGANAAATVVALVMSAVLVRISSRRNHYVFQRSTAGQQARARQPRPGNVVLRIFARLMGSIVLYVVLAAVIDILDIGIGTAGLILVGGYAPALFFIWASASRRVRVLDSVRTWLSREWRLVPFYVAAILVSIAALRYILRG